jgi:hypothetical protein
MDQRAVELKSWVTSKIGSELEFHPLKGMLVSDVISGAPVQHSLG